MKKMLAILFVIFTLLIITPGCQKSEQVSVISPTPTVSLPDQTHRPAETTLLPEQDKSNKERLAVWCWDYRCLSAGANRDQYVSFLLKHKVTEVYLCYPNFKHKDLAEIVRYLRAREIEVSLLSGDCWWIDADNHGEDAVIDAFLTYQARANEDEKLLSLHLDVEPHQREDFWDNQAFVLNEFAKTVRSIASRIHAAGEKIEWDIAFWLDDYTITDIDQSAKPLLTVLAENADTLCLMSYRDTADAILEISQKEISLCQEYNCKIILGIETHSKEGEHVSFMEEGKTYMRKQMDLVYDRLATIMPTGQYGMAVHYLDTWYQLRE